MARGWQNAIVLAMALLGSSAAIYFASNHLSYVIAWEKAFSPTTKFGENCLGAVGQWQPEDTWRKVLLRTHELKSMSMPLRKNPNRPKLEFGEYLVTKCPIAANQSDGDQAAWLYLGRIYGPSAVFLNDRLILTQSDNDVAEFPLPPNSLDPNGGTLAIVSKVLPRGVAGLATTVPPVLITDRAHLNHIRNALNSWFNELPAARLALVMGLLVIFALAYLFGIRYPDIGWVVVLLSVIGLAQLFLYQPIYSIIPEKIADRLTGATYFAIYFSMAFFSLAFLRIPPFGLVRNLGFVVLIALATGLCLMVSPSVFFEYRLYVLTPTIVGGILLLGVFAMGMKRLYRESGLVRERYRRKKIFLWVLGVATLLLFFECYLQEGLGIYIDMYIAIFLAGIFAIFCALDFVVFERLLLVEKGQRLEDKKKHEVDQAIAEMTQLIAHDVRKPFHILQFLMQDMAAMIPAGQHDHYHRTLDNLNKNYHKVDLMLNDVLNVNQALTVDVATVSIRALLFDCLNRLAAGTLNQSAMLKYRFDYPFMVEVDPMKMERVLTNILENALIHINDRGTISITTVPCTEQNDFMEVRIHNTGSHIDGSHIPKIFEMFYSNENPSGTGLGLAICKKIIAAHGGDISCQVNDGVEFIFSIPVSQLRDQESLELPSTIGKSLVSKAGSEESFFVVLIDDNAFIRELWQEHSSAIQLSCFHSPSQFLDRLDSAPNLLGEIDVIVTDMYFQGKLSGEDLADQLKTRGVKCPVLLSTSGIYADAGGKFSGLLDKRPYSKSELMRYSVNKRAE